MLVQYIRNENREPVGVVVAISADQIGWSRVRENSGDRFCKHFGKKIAVGRAEVGSLVHPPKDIIPAMEKMYERAGRYYKPQPQLEEVFDVRSVYEQA